MSTPSRPHLSVICGPMFAGKSTALLRHAADAHARGLSLCALKPRRDTRSSAQTITTHTGHSLPCSPIEDPAQIPALARDASVVLIDEAHFFGLPLLDPVKVLLASTHIHAIVVAGLERDHRGHPFEPFPGLLVEADTVLKLSTPCALCGAPAVHSQRLVNSTARILVGGSESYSPRCRACFVPGP